ncbi:MAG: DUF4062 domain-containing protein [Deltaproteobacteria bacterium]|nr:DUF4062 domain-containing protein [Deltaproteobacteria bacterium]
MEKRYQVFVSSTYEDLREERQEVMQALLELDCIPTTGMGLFLDANEDQWTLTKGLIDDCDYYVVIIGGRYGSNGLKNISYTQLEYEYAVSQNKPIIAFLHKYPESLPAIKCEKTEAGRKKLEEFRDLARKKMYRFWASPTGLGFLVSRSMIKLIKARPAVGWARANLLPDPSSLEEILCLRKRVEKVENALGTLLPGTEHLSQGKETITLNIVFEIFEEADSWFPFKKIRGKFTTSWNNLFSNVSFLLFDEASDEDLKVALERFVAEQFRLVLIEKRPEWKDLAYRIVLSTEEFNMIKIQFLGLRLISKSTKGETRSKSDQDLYWMLTPHGELVMSSLIAIKKNQLSN